MHITNNSSIGSFDYFSLPTQKNHHQFWEFASKVFFPVFAIRELHLIIFLLFATEERSLFGSQRFFHRFHFFSVVFMTTTRMWRFPNGWSLFNLIANVNVFYLTPPFLRFAVVVSFYPIRICLIRHKKKMTIANSSGIAKKQIDMKHAYEIRGSSHIGVQSMIASVQISTWIYNWIFV